MSLSIVAGSGGPVKPQWLLCEGRRGSLRPGRRRTFGAHFRKWTFGLVSELLSARLVSVDVEAHLTHSRTDPGVAPLVRLDHIYHDPDLELAALRLHRTRHALWASDHLPLSADLRLARSH